MYNPENISIYSTPAIVLRRVEYGDYDYILTFITKNKGKVSAIAKNAKKSVKRFSGNLELFYCLDIVLRDNGRSVLLQETSIKNPHEEIRRDIIKTAYASYWAEVVVQWLEENVEQEAVYRLMEYVLDGLDSGQNSPEELSILFQLKFLDIAGLSPLIEKCRVCKKDLDSIECVRFFFDIEKGGLVCGVCGGDPSKDLSLLKGTIKKLLWLKDSSFDRAGRVKFSNQAIKEGLLFFETFLPYHLEKELRSLKFLKRFRPILIRGREL